MKTTSEEMAPQPLDGHTVVVAGGAGHVGSFIVRALLERGPTVALPSRSEEKPQAAQSRCLQARRSASVCRGRRY